MTATLTVTSNLSKANRTVNSSDCVRVITNEFDTVELNSSLCSYFKQYPLPNQYYATICSYQGEIRIDLRKFINKHPSILGIYFNINQWNYLKRLDSFIDNSIKEASLID